LENELPDLILSDVMMPSMNGFELCAKVKADEDLQHIPFILLTAKTDPKSQHYGLQQQADDYIGKPFSSDALLQRLANKLNTHFALKQKLQTELLSTPVEKNVTNIVQQKIHDLLALNFSREDFTITELANELGMSDKTLTRKLKVLFNCTFTGLLKDYRLNVACEMLKAGKPVKEVAFMCGFNSQAYFGAMFKQKYQQTPGSFATGPKKILK
jgi:YesN/AraC family two-component response regulator